MSFRVTVPTRDGASISNHPRGRKPRQVRTSRRDSNGTHGLLLSPRDESQAALAPFDASPASLEAPSTAWVSRTNGESRAEVPIYTPSAGFLTYLNNPYARLVPRTLLSPLVVLQSALMSTITEYQDAMTAVDPLVMPHDRVFRLEDVLTFEEHYQGMEGGAHASYVSLLCKEIVRQSRKLKVVAGSTSMVRVQFMLQHRHSIVYNEVVMKHFEGRFHDFVASVPQLRQFVVHRIDKLEDLQYTVSLHERRITTGPLEASIAHDALVGRNVRTQVVDMFLPRYIAHALDLTAHHTRWENYVATRDSLWLSCRPQQQRQQQRGAPSSQHSSQSMLASGPHDEALVYPPLSSLCSAAELMFGPDLTGGASATAAVTRKSSALMELIAQFADIMLVSDADLRLARFNKQLNFKATAMRQSCDLIIAKLGREFPPLICLISNIRLHEIVTDCLRSLLLLCCTEGVTSFSDTGNAQSTFLGMDCSSSLLQPMRLAHNAAHPISVHAAPAVVCPSQPLSIVSDPSTHLTLPRFTTGPSIPHELPVPHDEASFCKTPRNSFANSSLLRMEATIRQIIGDDDDNDEDGCATAPFTGFRTPAPHCQDHKDKEQPLTKLAAGHELSWSKRRSSSMLPPPPVECDFHWSLWSGGSQISSIRFPPHYFLTRALAHITTTPPLDPLDGTSSKLFGRRPSGGAYSATPLLSLSNEAAAAHSVHSLG